MTCQGFQRRVETGAGRFVLTRFRVFLGEQTVAQSGSINRERRLVVGFKQFANMLGDDRVRRFPWLIGGQYL